MSSRLTPERWEHILRLFEAAVALPPAERGAWLAEACGPDVALHEEIESLLAADALAADRLQVLDGLMPSAAAPPPPVPSPARRGKMINRYQIIERLGKGGMGEVYRAYDPKLDRYVALKFLTAYLSEDETARARFLQEARAASALDHPNVGTVYEVGEADGEPFIVMAFYDGETLKDRIKAGPLALPQVLDYAAQMARGLAAAHAHGIVHRDVKPANVMCTAAGPGEAADRLTIVDFGLAKTAGMHLTRTGTTMGTVAYMSPEQTRGEDIDHRTDIWAIGVILYEMLTGARPFTGHYDQAIVYAILNEEPPPLHASRPPLPEALCHIVAMCLEKERAHRYPSMADLVADLEMIQQGSGTLTTATVRPPTVRPAAVGSRWPRARVLRIGMALLAVVVVMLAGFGMYGVFSEAEADIPAQRNLAVLPFDNVGGADGNDAFIDGLVYTITGKLTEMEQFQEALSVVPARDVLRAGLLTSAEAARAYNVNLVVSGSVQRTDAGLRVILELVDPVKGTVIASRRLDAAPERMAALQDEVVFKLAELLELELNPSSRRVLTAGRTDVPVAFEFYTRALGYLQRFEDETNIDAAISLFRLAIKEDTSYALAYAGLGEAYLRLYKSTNAPDLVAVAIESGEQAAALNDDLAPVHVTLGLIYAETGQDEKAELAYLRALALEPNSAAAHHALGRVYEQQGKLDKAEESLIRALTRKPGYWLYHNNLGQFYSRHGRHREAIGKFETVISLQPDNPWGYNNVGVQYEYLGEFDAALQWYERAARVNPQATQATAYALYNLGGINYYLDRFAEADTAYALSAKILDTDIGIWSDLGNARHWAGNDAGARTAWQKAAALAEARLAVNASDTYAMSVLARAQAALGDTAHARTMLGLLLATGDLSAADLVAVGKAFEMLGDRAAAIRYLVDGVAAGYDLGALTTSAWLDALRADPAYAAVERAAPATPSDR